MRKHSVIIVGGGLGGATCAFFCSKLGLDVLMVEKDQFPRDKICGDGLQAPMYPILKEMGILDDVLAVSFPNNGLAYVDSREERAVMYFPPEIPPHYSCPRYIYDAIVNKAAVDTGIDYMDNFEALEVITRRGQACGVRGLYNGSLLDLECDLVILANGSHSMLSRQMGFYEEDPDYVFYGLRGYFDGVRGIKDESEFVYADIFRDGGYVWLFPEGRSEDGTTRCNVGVFITEANLKDLDMTMEEILWWWRDNTKTGDQRLGKANLVGKLEGWRLPTGKHQAVHSAGVMAVGDAGNMIDQCYGGGAGTAMISGKIAAGIASEAVKANDFSKEFLNKYEDTIEKVLGSFFEGVQIWRDHLFGKPETVIEFVDYVNSGGPGAMTGYLMSKGIELPAEPYSSK
jgi:flavin-dependent dehydrogenase